MKIFPAIDLMDGKCVRLTQGDYGQKKEYNANPLEVAKSFQDEGLKYLHVVDLDGARAGKIMQWKTIEELTKNTTLVIDVGGGIKSKDDIERLFSVGVSKVNVGSVAVKDPEMVYEWLALFGSDRIILSADVKDDIIAINGWREQSGIDLFSFISQYVKNEISHVTCTDISTDGTLKGPAVTLYKKLMMKFPTLKIIASGGVGSVHHLDELASVGVEGVIVGKAIYENKISLKELLNY